MRVYKRRISVEKYVVTGGRKLSGTVEISGMKNAAVAIIFGTILCRDRCVIENLPQIQDVTLSLEILKSMGISVRSVGKNTVEIDTSAMIPDSVPFELVRKMRASYYLLGSELGRFGRAYTGFPGGCDFGVRPIDQHIKGFEALGADVKVEGGFIEAQYKNGRSKGASIYLDVISVGATINIMLASVCTDGITVIENAAKEPHVVDTANFLNACGADIKGAGTDVIKIKGVDRLHGCNYAIIPDMIEAGTYMAMAAATGSTITVNNVIPKHLESITAKLEEMGVEIVEDDEAITVKAPERLGKCTVKTQPYPGFPTDMQPQICVLQCLADGLSILTENVWDNRFRYVDELRLMGASIKVDGKTAMIDGPVKLSAAKIKAVDLRAGAAMIIAALAANGTTEITNIYSIQRGYEDIENKLKKLGADFTYVSEPDGMDSAAQ